MSDPFYQEYEDIRQFLENAGESKLLESLDSMRELYQMACEELDDVSRQMPDY